MVTFVRMPQKGLTEESAILSKWYVKKGDAVKEGQYLFALETGKATFDAEAEVSGTILELLGNEGDEIAIKAVVCVIGEPGESYRLEGAERSAVPAPPAPAEASSVPAVPAKAAASEAERLAAAGEKLRISPRARRLAEREGLAAASIIGTGPGGRIIEEDVKAALVSRPKTGSGDVSRTAPAGETRVDGAAAYRAVPHDRMRKTIAANMTRSLRDTAQFTLTASFDATDLLEYRGRYNASHTPEEKLTVNDFIVFAVSRVLPDYPYLNAHYTDEELRLFVNVDLGVAVAAPKGLYVPTVKGADRKSLAEISREIKDLALACREGRIGAEDLGSGTFTVTNIGSYGIEFFTPILNPPQTGILGVGKIGYRRKPASGGMVDYPAMGLSLTADHRAVDGTPAAEFLRALVTELESFSLLLVK